ncbi:lipoprotein [Marmoricola endophyticus]|uniref:Lipoprotein n=1 Tax=Marmoricola endophyticus TaxID=2040280 RepID=A0A917BAK1_9ACTN|nr:Ig-like domain-containing protein [Marmoricola endophyticus]GGF31415.1 lipoprotein [Marmoricola endophyticus]
MPFHHRIRLRRAALGTAAALMVLPVAACAGGSNDETSSPAGSDASQVAKTSKATISANVSDGSSDVAVDKLVQVSSTDGTFADVKVATLKGEPVAGALNADKTRWTATDRLDSGRKYRITATAEDSDGLAKKYTSRFDAVSLAKSDEVYPSITPLDGATMGVGMPVSVHFDYPVANKKLFEQHMKVTSSAGQKGSWNWFDDQNVHYRPAGYWKPNQKVTVAVDVNSLPAGNGRYGQMDRTISYDVSRNQVIKVNAASHQLQVFRDGKVIKTMPITTGKAGFTTRSGTKVITEKYPTKRMNSETIGINPDSADGYDLDDVKWAMRITNTGEFLHAAPWSVGSQGQANVSHGCTGMSTENAKWLYDHSIIGDPVEYTGTDRQMTLTNGYGDWNDSWAEWQKGSALA